MKPTRTLTATLLASSLLAFPLASAPLVAQAAPLVQLQSFAPLVEAAKPSVVTVVTRGSATAPGRPGRGQGIGSGFIIEADGVIVTNNHVVEGAGEISVILDDGSEHDATLLGRDDRIDIAVLRIDAGDALPTVAWGDSDRVRVGDWAVAIGNPLGLDGTVTAGIVSARGRDINSGPYDDYLQVDAAINRGNSGGPLFDLEGKVIGVNTAIISPSGGNVGLGFAIPAAQAKRIVEDLIDDGSVDRGWIGVSIQPLTDAIADSLGLSSTDGALVASVSPDSPAESAGLQAGDVILGFAQSDIAEVRDLTRAVANHPLGEETPLQVWRGNDLRTLQITPARLDTDHIDTPRPALSGIDLSDLGLDLSGTGEVRDIAPDTAAARAGLRPGDRIVSVNQRPTDTAQDVAAALEAARADRRGTVLILVEQNGNRRFVTLDLATS